MPTYKPYKCVKCDINFDVEIFTPAERLEAQRRNPNKSFGPVACPKCGDCAVVELDVFRGR